MKTFDVKVVGLESDGYRREYWLGRYVGSTHKDALRLAKADRKELLLKLKNRRYSAELTSLPVPDDSFSTKEIDNMIAHLDDETEWQTIEEFWDVWSPRLGARLKRLLTMARALSEIRR